MELQTYRVEPLLREKLREGEIGKRIFDLAFSLTVLFATWPLFLIIAFLIRATTRGPVFYTQDRLGKGGEQIRILKFCTMVKNADRILNELLAKNQELKKEFDKYFKLKKDPRITPLGRILRKTSLDELPQFLNVVRGEMSVIGPRPIIQREIPNYGKKIGQLLSIRPGITGLWQVSGRNEVPYGRRVALDIFYTEHHSILLDLKILFRTIPAMFRGHGAY